MATIIPAITVFEDSILGVYTMTASGDVGIPLFIQVNPFTDYTIQVVGVGAAATSWTVVLEPGLSVTDFDSGGLLTHTNSHGNKVMRSYDTLGVKPALYVRPNVTALNLGSATAIKVYILAVGGRHPRR